MLTVNIVSSAFVIATAERGLMRAENVHVGDLAIGTRMTIRRASAASGPAPSYEGDDRTDQEHNPGSDRENSNPLPDPALFPFIRRHVTNPMVFSTPFAKYVNCRSQIRACDLSSDRCGRSGSQSPIRNNSSHCRNSPLKPMLSATWKLEMTERSICLPPGWRKAHTCGIRYGLLPTRRRLTEVNRPLPCSVLELRDVAPTAR